MRALPRSNEDCAGYSFENQEGGIFTIQLADDSLLWVSDQHGRVWVYNTEFWPEWMKVAEQSSLDFSDVPLPNNQPKRWINENGEK